MAIAGRLCEGHVALHYMPCFKTKVSSAPVPELLTVHCTVIKLRGSVNRGGITVKMYKEHLLTQGMKEF